jgi:hypothetical protein
MPIRPVGLDRISAHRVDSSQLKRPFRKLLCWSSVHIAHDVGFSTAGCAWAAFSQLLQRIKHLDAVIPLDREFRAYLLQIRWPHLFDLDCMHASGNGIGLAGWEISSVWFLPPEHFSRSGTRKCRIQSKRRHNLGSHYIDNRRGSFHR